MRTTCVPLRVSWRWAMAGCQRRRARAARPKSSRRRGRTTATERRAPRPIELHGYRLAVDRLHKETTMVQRLRLAFLFVAITLIGLIPDALAQQWNSSQGLPDLTRIPLRGNDVHVFRHPRFPINGAPFDPELREWFRVFGQL